MGVTKAMRDLKELRGLTDDAIGAAESQGTVIQGAINWANLFCSEACYVLDDEGEERYQVSIEEVAPDNPTLQEFIENWLAEHGWPGVVVITEW